MHIQSQVLPSVWWGIIVTKIMTMVCYGYSFVTHHAMQMQSTPVHELSLHGPDEN